jgi:ATP-dependent RNA helicase DeaD
MALAREAFDVLRAVTVLAWRRGDPLPDGPLDAVATLDLPSRSELTELSARGPVVLLVSASQLGYARAIAAPLTSLAIGTAADRAIDRAEEIRAAVAVLLATRHVDGELALLRPLFERYDPAEVAAALLAIGAEPVHVPPPPRAEAGASRSRLFINVGKRDRAAAKDLVGALIREAGLAKEEIGRIEIRDAFSLVEVDAGALARAVAGLRGATIRGRRVAARLDRAE